jgi:dTDP-4-amino-4,6-dideoxygalactose transaminase
MDDFPFERALKRSVVVLPVHQSLDEADLAVIARAVRHWGRNRPLSGR